MSGFALREYQKQAVGQVLDCWERGKSCLLAMATGTGKTEVFLSATERWLDGNGDRALIVAHRVELLDQPVDRMAAHFPKLFAQGVGVVQGSRDECDQRIVVGSIQTLQSPDRLDCVLDDGRIGVLVIDEGHHALAKTYRELIDRIRRHNPEVRIIGATATPRGGSGKYGLRAVFDEVAFKLSINKAIKLGALVPFKPVAVDVPASFAGVKQVAGDYQKDQAAVLMSADAVRKAIVSSWLRKAKCRPTLAFTYTVEQAEALAEAFQAEGMDARCVHAGTPPEERASILERFKAGKIPVLTNVNIYGEGVDVPVASCMVQARPTCSDAVYAQMLGRILRTHEGKQDALVIDARPQDARDLFMAGDLLEGEALDFRRDQRLSWFRRGRSFFANTAKGRCIAAVPVDGAYQVFRVKVDDPKMSWRLGEAEDWASVQAFVDGVGGYEWWLASKRAAWRRKEPSPGQRRFLISLGGWEDRMTRGQASDAITARVAADVLLKYSIVEKPVDPDSVSDRIRRDLASTRRRGRFARRKNRLDERVQRLIREGKKRESG